MPKRKGNFTYILPTALPCEYRGEDSSCLVYPQTLHTSTLRGWAWCVTLAVPGVSSISPATLTEHVTYTRPITSFSGILKKWS